MHGLDCVTDIDIPYSRYNRPTSEHRKIHERYKPVN